MRDVYSHKISKHIKQLSTILTTGDIKSYKK